MQQKKKRQVLKQAGKIHHHLVRMNYWNWLNGHTHQKNGDHTPRQYRNYGKTQWLYWMNIETLLKRRCKTALVLWPLTYLERNWRHTKENKPNGGAGRHKTKQKRRPSKNGEKRTAGPRRATLRTLTNDKGTSCSSTRTRTNRTRTETIANANENQGKINGDQAKNEEEDELILKKWIAK